MDMDKGIVPPAQSSSTKAFPAGVRVLAVDDDIACLKIVETMLRTCEYEVAVKHALDALSTLRERQGGFDIVLTDVHMPDMDGFALLKRIELEFKLPVVMMSVDDKDHVMTRCLQNGASFYLKKPLTIKDLKNLWQFLVLKRRDEMMASEKMGNAQEGSPPEMVAEEDTECASSVNESNSRQESKRKKPEEKNEDGGEDKEDPATQKKFRVVWHNGLHNKFLEAIDQIGLDKAVPKKILELMNVPELTRENVASHLQKYRIFLKRLKEASQSAAEPGLMRSLTNGALRSSFASNHPSLMFNLQRGLFRIAEQQRACTAFQPRLGSCSITQQRNGNSPPTSNQEKLKQPLLATMSSSNQQNEANYSAFQMEPHNIRVGSSVCGDTSTGPVSGTNTVHMIHQQPQVRPGQFSSPPLDHNLSALGLQSNNIQRVGRMGSFSNLNQVPNFNYTNNNHTGIQITSTGDLVGSSRMPISRGPSNGTNCSYNMMNETCRDKMTSAAAWKSPPIPEFTSSHSGYATTGLASSNGFTSENQFPTMSTNVIQQQPSVAPPSLPQQEENGFDFGEEVDSLFNVIKNSSKFGNTSFSQLFDEGDDLTNFFYKQVDQSSNQQRIFEEVMDPEFNVSAYQVDDGPSLL